MNVLINKLPSRATVVENLVSSFLPSRLLPFLPLTSAARFKDISLEIAQLQSPLLTLRLSFVHFVYLILPLPYVEFNYSAGVTLLLK